MIEVVQAGQVDKTKLLFDMHRLRARVFKDVLQWNVDVDQEGLEVDQFDLPEAVYLLALDDDGRVIGSWRILSTEGPTMIRDIWPQFLETISMPYDPDIFEVSRFAVSSLALSPELSKEENQKAIGEMFCGLTELCILSGIKEVYTLYDERIEKVIARLNCHPYKTSEKLEIEDFTCQVGAFKTDEQMLETLREATGITKGVLSDVELPPLITHRIHKRKERMEANNAEKA